MIKHVVVYPTKSSALHLKHPHGHKMTLEGVTWPLDSFTGRRLADRSVTEDKAKAYMPPAEASESSSNPEPTPAPAPAAPAKFRPTSD